MGEMKEDRGGCGWDRGQGVRGQAWKDGGVFSGCKLTPQTGRTSP